jgi:hypothetical protein
VAAAIAIGAVAIASVPAAVAIDGAPVDPGSARFFPSIGYGAILVVGGLSAAVMIAAASLHWMRTRMMARWLVWLGFVCALALLFSVIFIPMIALPLWALVVAIVMLSRPMSVTTTMTPQPSMS